MTPETPIREGSQNFRCTASDWNLARSIPLGRQLYPARRTTRFVQRPTCVTLLPTGPGTGALMTTPGAVIEKAANACIGALLLAGTMDDATATAGMTLNALVGLGIGFRRRRPRSCDHIREGIRTAIDQRFPGLAESPEYTEHWENARARLDDAVQVSVPSLETLARASFTTEELSAALARSILNNFPLEAEDRENHTTAFKIIDVAVRAGVDAALASADFREQLAKEMVLALPVNIARQTELLVQI